MVKTNERNGENERGETKIVERKRGKKTLKRAIEMGKRMSCCMETKKGNKDSPHHMKQPHGGFGTA